MGLFSKKGKKREAPVRNVVFSLKIKITLLAISILIFTVVLISKFIIDHQNEILDEQMQKTMVVYLETFRNSAIKLLYENKDRLSLQEYVNQYTNIEGFNMAMYVDYSGTSIVHSHEDYVFAKISSSSVDKFFSSFENRLYFDYKITLQTNITPIKLTNMTIAVSTNYVEELTNLVYRTNLSVVYKTSTNGQVVMIERTTNIQQKYANIDGYMPIYLDKVFNIFSDNMRPLNRYYAQFAAQKMFAYKTSLLRNRARPVQPLSEELANNLRLIFAVRDAVERLLTDNGELTGQARVLIEAGKLTNSDVYYLAKRNAVFNDYYYHEYYFKLSDNTMSRIFSILSNAQLVPAAQCAEFAKMRQAGKLFTHAENVTPVERNNLRFIRYVEGFLGDYWKDGRPTDALNRFFDFMNTQKLYAWQTVDKSYYYGIFRKLDELYKKTFVPYLTGDTVLFPTTVQTAFMNLYGFYRLGTVRILINMTDINQKKDEIKNDTVDIAVIFILRMILITFFITTIIFSPLNALSKETDEITLKLNKVKVDGTEAEFSRSLDELKEYLEKTIRISNRDELGQLADRFNIMTRKFKITFDEIQDKYRMKGELGKAQEIQAAILPKGYPEIPNLAFAHVYEPQSESGGDYYDFVEIDDNRFGIVMADVTSHGVGAAMVMAILRSNLRTSAVKHGSYADKVLKDINPLIHRDTPSNMYASVFYGVFKHTSRELFYSMAGHEPGLIYNLNDQKIKKMKEGGIPVGTANSALFDPLVELSKVTLNGGDIFIEYTDGITEAKNAADELFGEQRFYASIKKNASGDLEAMKNGIIRDVKEFTAGAPQSDDITLLLMLVK